MHAALFDLVTNDVVLAVASVQRTVIENCSLTLDFVVSARCPRRRDTTTRTAIRERSRIAKNQRGTALTGSSYRHSGYNRTRENFAADIEARVMTKVYRQTLDLMLFFKR